MGYRDERHARNARDPRAGYLRTARRVGHDFDISRTYGDPEPALEKVADRVLGRDPSEQPLEAPVFRQVQRVPVRALAAAQDQRREHTGPHPSMREEPSAGKCRRTQSERNHPACSGGRLVHDGPLRRQPRGERLQERAERGLRKVEPAVFPLLESRPETPRIVDDVEVGPHLLFADELDLRAARELLIRPRDWSVQIECPHAERQHHEPALQILRRPESHHLPGLIEQHEIGRKPVFGRRRHEPVEPQ
jgi:hypothetical protein